MSDQLNQRKAIIEQLVN